ncbi:hypothetical protein BW721_01165 [Jeotgalibaca sp. PTS2502]|uniref:UvrB/UvrC motif-containing protein n=1 Tax=Jeotgalibaca sp. PTS2502 TaxID=1903686 RepID=UPI0009738259|nr:UvrB/UvrC motif-containing protein [Jeotgalibaca sp. PTS2502]APZ48412.1 hypothetical protein BW721_01165 [Jeotgalibaca sp. PTS2502]
MEWLNIAVTRSSVFRRVLKKLEEEMKESSLALRFEMAAYFKDMIDILKEKYRKLNDKDIEDFIRRGKALVLANPKFTDEKISMDFHDILYSEINSLSDEMVMIL